MTPCNVWGQTPVTRAQGKQRERDHRDNANLGFITSFSPLTQGFFIRLEFSFLLDINFYNLVIEERDESDIHFAAHTMPIFSEGISNSMVQEPPFHEKDIRVDQKDLQKSFGKTAFREDWSPFFFLSLLESITLSWVLSHSFSIFHFFNEISFFWFHFIIKHLNYNVISNFIVQDEEGNKRNVFSQWGLVDAYQQLNIKNSHVTCFYSSEFEMHLFYERTFLLLFNENGGKVVLRNM